MSNAQWVILLLLGSGYVLLFLSSHVGFFASLDVKLAKFREFKPSALRWRLLPETSFLNDFPRNVPSTPAERLVSRFLRVK